MSGGFGSGLVAMEDSTTVVGVGGSSSIGLRGMGESGLVNEAISRRRRFADPGSADTPYEPEGSMIGARFRSLPKCDADGDGVIGDDEFCPLPDGGDDGDGDREGGERGNGVDFDEVCVDEYEAELEEYIIKQSPYKEFGFPPYIPTSRASKNEQKGYELLHSDITRMLRAAKHTPFHPDEYKYRPEIREYFRGIQRFRQRQREQEANEGVCRAPTDDNDSNTTSNGRNRNGNDRNGTNGNSSNNVDATSGTNRSTTRSDNSNDGTAFKPGLIRSDGNGDTSRPHHNHHIHQIQTRQTSIPSRKQHQQLDDNQHRSTHGHGPTPSDHYRHRQQPQPEAIRDYHEEDATRYEHQPSTGTARRPSSPTVISGEAISRGVPRGSGRPIQEAALHHSEYEVYNRHNTARNRESYYDTVNSLYERSHRHGYYTVDPTDPRRDGRRNDGRGYSPTPYHPTSDREAPTPIQPRNWDDRFVSNMNRDNNNAQTSRFFPVDRTSRPYNRLSPLPRYDVAGPYLF